MVNTDSKMAISELNQRKGEHERKIKTIQAACDDLRKQNLSAVEARDNMSKKLGKLTSIRKAIIWVTIIACIGSLFIFDLASERIIFSGAMIAVAVALIIILAPKRATCKKEYEKLCEPLREYDKKVSEQIQLIRNERAEISRIESEIEDIEEKERIANFAETHKNQVLVTVKYAISVMEKPKESDAVFCPTKKEYAQVFIDGLEVGRAKSPFATFYVNPGVHTIFVKFYDQWNEVTTEAKQFLARDNCTMLYYYFEKVATTMGHKLDIRIFESEDPESFSKKIGEKVY